MSDAVCRSQDVLRAAGLRFVWEAEPNPWASLQPWAPQAEAEPFIPGLVDEGCKASAGETRAESAWWLCVAPHGWRGELAPEEATS
jgi:hypothetical protein